MLVVMQSNATEDQVRDVCKHIEQLGLRAHPIPGALRTAIGITGNNGSEDLGALNVRNAVVQEERAFGRGPKAVQALFVDGRVRLHDA